MKVYIGPYKNWIGPYQIAEKILFWRDKHEDDSVYDLGKKLSRINWLKKLCNWVESKKKRNIKVRIDEQDVWSLDSTLAYIIHPALKKMKDNKCGAPYVDDDDVPEHLRKSSAPPTENEWDVDDNHFKRWGYVLDEMIFAFEMENADWGAQFWKTQPKLDLKDYPEDEGKSTTPIRWEGEGECDYDEREKFEERIQNGFRLFGKYYQALWT